MGMEAGPELNALIGEMMGAQPRLSWNVMNPDETATAYHSDSKQECEHFLADTLRRMPDSWLKDYHVGSWKIWPRYSEEISAAWTVVEKMRERGFWLKLCTHWEGNNLVSVGFTAARDGSLLSRNPPRTRSVWRRSWRWRIRIPRPKLREHSGA